VPKALRGLLCAIVHKVPKRAKKGQKGVLRIMHCPEFFCISARKCKAVHKIAQCPKWVFVRRGDEFVSGEMYKPLRFCALGFVALGCEKVQRHGVGVSRRIGIM
jgi:hypothetical protein